MFESDDINEVRTWLRNLGFRLTRENGWIDDQGYIGTITFSGTKQKWCAAHTRPDEGEI